MRILLLVDKYFPHTQSCAVLMHDLGAALRDLGHEVVLATADPSIEGRRTIDREEGLTVIRARSGRLRGIPLTMRAYHEWRLPDVLWKGAGDYFLEHPCQLIVSYSPSIFLGPLVH